MKDIKEKIIQKIEDLKKERAEFDITLEEALEQSEKFQRFFFGTDEDKAELAEEAKATRCWVVGNRLANIHDEIERLQDTLELDLMVCEKKYVVTDTARLTSPAGFHPEEGVFLQTKIAIHTDSLTGLPSSNVTLYGHKVN